ncbi:MAG: Rrf2 family transcriptional regulator, partial [Verrucomicrobiales bacterium]
RFGREVVSVAMLAESEKLPFKFLENILADLRRAGFVESRRGKLGGVRLAQAMESIKMGAVIRVIDGRLAPIGCASDSAYEKCSCPDEDHCGLRMLMIDVRNALAGILDRYTLADVVAVTLRKMERDGVTPDLGAASDLPPGGAAAGGAAAEEEARPEHPADPHDGFLNWLVGKPLKP